MAARAADEDQRVAVVGGGREARDAERATVAGRAVLGAQLERELVYIKTCFGTKDVAEAIAAFTEKRKPDFRGR